MAGVRDVLETVRADDFVEYFIFTLEDLESPEQSSAILKRIQQEITSIVQPLTANYIWQKDEFQVIERTTSELSPVVDKEEQLPPHLYGVTHYGDNIEDEWFIVYLLVEITKRNSNLIARVVDTDGEFLLIEAADHLPPWASPEVCDKRVYIHKGEIHMIPMEPDEDEDDIMTVIEAMKQIKSHPQATRSSDGVQRAIQSRTQGYPDKILELLHQTNAYVPATVAKILKERPCLIAPAVTAFCHRDPIDMRVCRAMRYFPPETRVMTQVKMTRCLYAMLLHHKYTPDRRTGWHLPPPNSPKYLAHSIGVKLACGFEILVSQVKGNNSNDLTYDRDWIKYKKSLTEKGYFKGLLEGSQEYKRLEGEAQDYYKKFMMYSQPTAGQTIHDLLQNLEVDVEEMRKAESTLPPPDDDSWMEISSEELDKMLAERYGAKPDAGPSEIPSRLTSFLEHISGLEGAELPTNIKEGVPLRPKRKKQKEEGARDDENNRISMDQEAFSCAVQNILDFVVPEDSWDLESEGSGMSAYEDELEMDLSRKKTTRTRGQAARKDSENEIKQYMDQMDRELANTTMGQSFHRKSKMEDSFSDIESFEPVDIDMNALRNILKSYEAQMGGAGPASNLLGPMGVRLQSEK